MTIRAILVGIFMALAVISCGGGGGDNFAGGIGGTGVSYGPVTGFGSVIVNGVEYDTSSADFSVEGTNGDQSDLAVGMVVTVTHDDNDNAKSISYKDNVEGPVANKVDVNGVNGSFDVLGVSVTVDSLTVYEGTTGITALTNNDIVEVSGQITAENTVLATRVEKKGTCATLGAGDEVEVKGTITSIIDADSFVIGSLTVNYSGDPTGLQVGDYVEAKSDDCPAGNAIAASSVELENEGPDLSDLDEGEDGMEIKGLIADFVASPCAFTVNSQSVIAADGLCTTLANGEMVEVEGNLNNNGDLVASQISHEDSDEDVDTELCGTITVNDPHTAFEGTIKVDGGSDITVDLTTLFHGETQDFNLDTLDAATTTAEVKVDSSLKAISIEEDSCI